MNALARLLVMAIALGAAACRPTSSTRTRADSAQLSERAAKLQQRLGDSASGAERALPVARWLLPPSLSEISGLALTSDGRILAHGDELGRVSVIDPKRGVILKEFRFGARADFEGITVAGGLIYMIDSDGQLYAFREGASDERVAYQLIDTRLGQECEFEGVAYDPSREALLLPCKNVKKKSMSNNLVIYVWKLHDTDPPRLSIIAIPLARIIGDNPWKSLRPTDITVDPTSGNYVLVAAHEKALIELTPNGEVVRAMPLPERDQHSQAEGVAITTDGILIISDEASNRAASITLYRWPLAPATTVAP